MNVIPAPALFWSKVGLLSGLLLSGCQLFGGDGKAEQAGADPDPTFSGWEYQHPAPRGSEFRAVHFPDPAIGYIAGGRGLIAGTRDGGQSWRNLGDITVLPTENLHAIHCADNDNCHAVGANGTLLSTSDGGAGWIVSTDTGKAQMNAVFAVSPQVAYAAGSGGAILKTSDGGRNWVRQISGTAKNLNGVWFLSPLQGFAVGDSGIILKTVSGGDSWATQPPLTTKNLRAVHFRNAGKGLIAGDGGIILLSENAADWDSVNSGTGGDIRTISLVSDDKGFAHTNLDFMKTEDGGRNWTREEFGWGGLNALSFPTGTRGYLTDNYGGIFTTQDGGNTWVEKYNGATDLGDLQFLNDVVGFAAGEYGNIVKTVDRGRTWRRINTGSEQTLNSVFFLDAKTGFATGDGWGGINNHSFKAMIIRTRNGGETWDTVYENGNMGAVNAVHFGDAGTGYAAGSNGTLLKTADGGQTWTGTDLGFGELNDVFFLTKDVGWASSDFGVHKTTNGGLVWSSASLSAVSCDTRDNSVHFINADTGFLMSIGGCLLKTVDGGVTWTAKEAESQWGFKSISFVNDTLGYVVGTVGELLKTTDAGETWSPQPFAPEGDFSAIQCRTSGICYTAGSGGNIFKFR